MHPLSAALSFARLQEILAHFAPLRTAILGDLALDAYWDVDMTRSRLSRETPHFPRPVVAERYAPGAGANVAQNLAALGLAQVDVFSVVGPDPWAGLLRAQLERRGIGTDGMFSAAGRRTPAYIKPLLMGYNSQQEDARLDFENTTPLPAAAEDELLRRLHLALPELDVLIVADQLEEFGVVSPRVRARLNELALHHPSKIFLVDSRTRIGQYRGMWLKPNALEAATAAPGADSPAAAGQTLSRAAGRAALVTLSENGVLVCTPEDAVLVPAAPVRPPLDVVGAGDTFLAALAAALAAGASTMEAAALANLAAAVTVEKLHQTGTAAPAEILERYRALG